MRKLRDRLNNKKGFTLVELIVVIVIILILAAVLVPNVMRYIGQAREASFQQEATSYMTEVQGYAAEKYAKRSEDIKNEDFAGSGEKYDLTDGNNTSCKVVTTAWTNATNNFKSETVSVSGKKREISVAVKDGALTNFAYRDGEHYVNWSQVDGWTDVDDDDWDPGN